MPFSFTNTPTIFQCLMKYTLAGLVGYQCLIYLDNVIIFSSTFSDHLRYLAIVFVRLKAVGLKWKANKCCHFILYRNKLYILVKLSPAKELHQTYVAKLTAVTTYPTLFPTPQNTKEVKQFMDILNYYRFILAAQIAEPLHFLL